MDTILQQLFSKFVMPLLYLYTFLEQVITISG